MSTPLFTMQRFPLGWVLSGPGGRVPMDALSQATKGMPKTAVIVPGVCNYLKATLYPDAVMAIAETQADAEKWEAEITAKLGTYDSQTQWLYGTDTGLSSKAVFAVFCDKKLRLRATEHNAGSVPYDCADLGRCLRMLTKFPAWESRLNEVADAYPNTKWPAIIARWLELKAADHKKQNEILREILNK